MNDNPSHQNSFLSRSLDISEEIVSVSSCIMRMEISRSNSEILFIFHTSVILRLYILSNRILTVFEKVIVGKKYVILMVISR